MRRAAAVAFILGFTALPLFVAAETDYKDAAVRLLDGTVMVKKADGSAPQALETGSVVEEGDAVTVYDKSWVILKTRQGDQIGILGDTVASFDQLDKEGSDRSVRIILQRGTLLLRATGAPSQQSYFEVHTGSVVTSLGDSDLILTYDPAIEHLRIQHLRGRISVFDKGGEHHLKEEGVIWDWKDGVMQQTADQEPDDMDQLDITNFHRFFNGDPILQAPPTY